MELVKIRTNVVRSKRGSGKKADILSVQMERLKYPDDDITQKPVLTRERITVTPEGVFVDAGDAQTIVGMHRRVEIVEHTNWASENRDSLMAALTLRGIPFDQTTTNPVMVDLLENPPGDDDDEGEGPVTVDNTETVTLDSQEFNLVRANKAALMEELERLEIDYDLPMTNMAMRDLIENGAEDVGDEDE